MDAPVTVFSGNINRRMVWTGCSSHRILLERTELWLEHGFFQSPYSLRTRTELWLGHGCPSHHILFGHACSSHSILLEHERSLGTRTESWFGLDALVTVFSSNERNYGLEDMDVLVTVFSWCTNGIRVRAWMHKSPCSLRTLTEILWFGHGWSYQLWFGHGCFSHRILLVHERN